MRNGWERWNAQKRNRSPVTAQIFWRRHEDSLERKGDPASDQVERATKGRDGARAAPSGASGLRVTSGASGAGLEEGVSRPESMSGLIIACWLEHG